MLRLNDENARARFQNVREDSNGDDSIAGVVIAGERLDLSIGVMFTAELVGLRMAALDCNINY